MKKCKLHKYIVTNTHTQMYTLLDLRNIQNAKMNFFFIRQ